MRDPSSTFASLRAPSAPIRSRIIDPVKFVIGFVGQGGGNVDQSMNWVRDMLFMGLKSTLTRMIKAGEPDAHGRGRLRPGRGSRDRQ